MFVVPWPVIPPFITVFPARFRVPLLETSTPFPLNTISERLRFAPALLVIAVSLFSNVEPVTFRFPPALFVRAFWLFSNCVSETFRVPLFVNAILKPVTVPLSPVTFKV